MIAREEASWRDCSRASTASRPLLIGSTPSCGRSGQIERGWTVEDTVEKLTEVSPKAQERIRVKNDPGYTLLTARNAAVCRRGTGARPSPRRNSVMKNPSISKGSVRYDAGDAVLPYL
jgi:hypothetical protein